MARFLILSLCLIVIAAADDSSTVSDSLFRAVICRHHFLAESDGCKNGPDDEGGDVTTTNGPSDFLVPSVPAVHVSVHLSMTVGTKIAIAVGVSSLFYLGLVLFLKFRLGMPWARAVQLGCNAGRLTARCYVYVYPRPNDEVAVSEV